ncbi:MAG: hypothetical protein ACE5GM_03830 [bacterium]
MSRRKKEKASVSLFSFLDILTFCIGNLILILISITLISSESDIKDVLIKVKSENIELGKEAVYIEVKEDKVVVLPEMEETPLRKLDQPGSPYMRLLESMNREKKDLIYAIRPRGILTFKKARSLAETRSFDIGYEAIDTGWNIKIK